MIAKPRLEVGCACHAVTADVTLNETVELTAGAVTAASAVAEMSPSAAVRPLLRLFHVDVELQSFNIRYIPKEFVLPLLV
jgi:hypothetical protein